MTHMTDVTRRGRRGLPRRQTRAALVEIVVVLVLLGACSGGDEEGREQPSAEAEAESDESATVEARPSDGCGTTTVAAGEERVTLQSGGAERWYFRHVPSAHDSDEPVPLILDLHGYQEGAEVHKANSQLGELGDEEGFVTLTPHGPGQGPVPMWDTRPDGVDVAFVADLLDEAERSLCIDLARVYVTGLSNGAMMTSALACAFGDRIAAVAPVAGVTAIEDCAAERPIPVVSFHGTEDPFLDYEGGLGPAVAQLPAPSGEGTLGEMSGEDAEELNDAVPAGGPAVPEVMADWAARNECDDTAPTETEVADDVTLLSFACPHGAEVELYRIEGGGHTWPGSHLLEGAVELVGTTTFSISANEIMWSFFEDHPLGA